MLAAGAFSVNLDARAIVPLLPSVAEDLGVTVAAAGLVITAYMVPYGALQLAYGPLADRFGRLPIARLTMCGFAVGTAACSLAGSLETLGLLRLLAGATAAAIFPMGLAFIGDAFPYRDRPGAISILLTASTSAQLVSLALSGILAGFVSWRAIFVLSGVLAILVVLALAWVAGPERPTDPKLGTLDGYRQILSARLGWAVPALGFAEGALLYGGLSYLGAFMRDTWLLSYPAIGLILAVYGVATLTASRLLAWAARRFSEPARFLTGMLVHALGYALAATVQPWQALPPIMALLGLGFIAAHSVLQSRATELAPGARGTAVAVFACALFLGGAIGTALTGAAIEAWSYRPVLAMLAIGMIGLALTGWAGLRQIARA